MANHHSHAALPYPIRGARYTLLIPYLDADGDPTDPTTPDTEVSKDDLAAADTAEEVSSPKNSIGMLTLTGAETDAACIGLAAKSASGPKTSLATIYPRVLAVVGSGTLSAGSAGGGTLGTLLAYDVTGCFIKTTGGTGGGGAGGANNQARKIVTYNTSTGAFTVTPNWETTPDATTTYEVLLPEGVTLGMLRTLNPVTPGRTLAVGTDNYADARVKAWGASNEAPVYSETGGAVYPRIDLQLISGGAINTASAQIGCNVASMSANTVTASAIADNAIDRAAFAADTGLQTARSGTAQAGGATSITLDASASSTNDFYKHAWVRTTGGTGVGQTRLITAYVGSTKVATVDRAWATNPDNTTTFAIIAQGGSVLGITVHGGSGFELHGVLNADFIGDMQGDVTGNVNVNNFTADAKAQLEAEVVDAIESRELVLLRTTIATLASQTSFTLTAGSTDDGAYKGCLVVVRDSVTAAQKAVAVCSAYTGSSRTLTLLNDPGVFTMAVGDFVTIIPDRSLKATVDNRTLDVSAGGEAGMDWANVGSPTTTVTLSGTTVKTATDVETIVGTSGVVVAAASKTGYALSATGLDAIAVTDPGAPASHSSIPKMVVALWRHHYKKTTLTATQLKHFADDGTTVNATATVSDDGTTQTKGASS